LGIHLVKFVIQLVKLGIKSLNWVNKLLNWDLGKTGIYFDNPIPLNVKNAITFFSLLIN